MYDRPDVPKGGPHSNAIAAGVLVVIVAAVVVLVHVLWGMAQQHSKLGDGKLGDAVSSAATVELPVQDGVVAGGDEVTRALVVMLSDDESSEDLVALRLVSLNETRGSSALVDVPLDVGLGAASVAETYAGGVDTLVKAFAQAAGMPVSHVVVVRQSAWDSMLATAAKGASALVKAAPGLMAGVVRSDMGAQDLLDLAKAAAGGKIGAVEQVTVPTKADETGATVIDPVRLGLVVGTLRQL